MFIVFLSGPLLPPYGSSTSPLVTKAENADDDYEEEEEEEEEEDGDIQDDPGASDTVHVSASVI